MGSKTVAIFGYIVAAVVSFSAVSWARLAPPEGTEDIPWLASQADFVFHARVLSIETVQGKATVDWEENVATLAVDRWYKGAAGRSLIRLQYVYPGYLIGHDCIDLQRTSSWLIFAKKGHDNMYELSDNCQGALPMSSILAAAEKRPWSAQLQQDLIAGLKDADPDVRLANIARLGGLKLRSSAPALHEFIEHGSDLEQAWAIYAALRSGDPGVLARVEPMAIEDYSPLSTPSSYPSPDDAAPSCSSEHLELFIRDEIENLRAPEAIPMLAAVARQAKDHDVRERALSAIRGNTDPRAVPGLISLLSDPDAELSAAALTAIQDITGELSCQQDPGEAASLAACQNWWDREGRFFDWTEPDESVSTQPKR